MCASGIKAGQRHLNHAPTDEAFNEAASGLSRRALLLESSNAPMLVINGADDYFLPQSDILVFNGRPQTEVRLISGTDHCAMSKLYEALPVMIAWLRTQFFT